MPGLETTETMYLVDDGVYVIKEVTVHGHNKHSIWLTPTIPWPKKAMGKTYHETWGGGVP